MSSLWQYRLKGEASPPMSFDDLARQFALGKLVESDLVCRVGTSDWQRADAVVGLLRRAHQLQSATEEAANLASRTPSAGVPKTACAAGRSAAPMPTSPPFPAPSANASDACTGDDAESTDDEIPRGIVGPWRIGFVVAVITAATWFGWRAWSVEAERRRFPLPVALRDQPSDWQFLGWGPLSLTEYAILWCDTVGAAALAAYVIWQWFRPGKRSLL